MIVLPFIELHTRIVNIWWAISCRARDAENFEEFWLSPRAAWRMSQCLRWKSGFRRILTHTREHFFDFFAWRAMNFASICQARRVVIPLKHNWKCQFAYQIDEWKKSEYKIYFIAIVSFEVNTKICWFKCSTILYKHKTYNICAQIPSNVELEACSEITDTAILCSEGHEISHFQLQLVGYTCMNENISERKKDEVSRHRLTKATHSIVVPHALGECRRLLFFSRL